VQEGRNTQIGDDGTTSPNDEVSAIPVMRPWLDTEEAIAVADVVASGWVAQGPRAAEFERVLATRVGAAHGVAASSGTAALHLALSVLDLAPDDEVVVPSLSYIATANAPRAVGAKPVFADVDAATLNLTAATIEAVVTPATRAVLVVHQAGVPADLHAIRALCDPRGIEVVEDAACALGADHRGTPIGGSGGLVSFSFHPRKVITTGEGGMVTTASDAWAGRMRRLRDHGSDVSAWARHRSSTTVEQYVEPGFNFRLSDLLAAVGLVQMTRLDEIVARRRALAATYRELLRDLPLRQVVDDPAWGHGCYQSFWVELENGVPGARDAVLERLFEQGVLARRGIMAAHREPAFADTDHLPLPVTERMTDGTLILPLFHTMTEDEQMRVVAALGAALT
jgi:dTDP-4-amino-4,6-dideoxygalactose transaminase